MGDDIRAEVDATGDLGLEEAHLSGRIELMGRDMMRWRADMLSWNKLTTAPIHGISNLL